MSRKKNFVKGVRSLLSGVGETVDKTMEILAPTVEPMETFPIEAPRLQDMANAFLKISPHEKDIVYAFLQRTLDTAELSQLNKYINE